ncbi:hypothetical protein [Pseudomonas helleri]|uniref:hypothetical protein n=1 Tax=Pseudomonas helleri TaxID=1608996 RepID=UPI003F95A63E
MSDMVCRKSMMRCQTPGMCSPHGGCRDEVTTAKDRQISALIAENERLHESDQEATELCDTLSVLLGEIAVAVRGPEEPKSRHGFHDLPSRVKTVVSERDQLKAENERLRADYAGLARFNPEWDRVAAAQDSVREHMAMVVQLKAENAGLKTGYEAYERVNAELKAENERLRREREGKVLCDLELFETLRDAANTEADEHRKCMATYRPLRQENLDSVVKKCDDLLAAMGKGEQS